MRQSNSALLMEIDFELGLLSTGKGIRKDGQNTVFKTGRKKTGVDHVWR